MSFYNIATKIQQYIRIRWTGKCTVNYDSCDYHISICFYEVLTNDDKRALRELTKEIKEKYTKEYGYSKKDWPSLSFNYYTWRY
jgi:hypothetical protein